LHTQRLCTRAQQDVAPHRHLTAGHCGVGTACAPQYLGRHGVGYIVVAAAVGEIVIVVAEKSHCRFCVVVIDPKQWIRNVAGPARSNTVFESEQGVDGHCSHHRRSDVSGVLIQTHNIATMVLGG
jgi:hypothetical protein